MKIKSEPISPQREGGGANGTGPAQPTHASLATLQRPPSNHNPGHLSPGHPLTPSTSSSPDPSGSSDYEGPIQKRIRVAADGWPAWRWGLLESNKNKWSSYADDDIWLMKKAATSTTDIDLVIVKTAIDFNCGISLLLKTDWALFLDHTSSSCSGTKLCKNKPLSYFLVAISSFTPKEPPKVILYTFNRTFDLWHAFFVDPNLTHNRRFDISWLDTFSPLSPFFLTFSPFFSYHYHHFLPSE